MITPKQIVVKSANKPYTIQVFGSNKSALNLINDRVNIFASGPSIGHIHFDKPLLKEPSIFVNGSLSLLAKYNFEKVVGYVISDARFVKHNGDLFKQLYRGQPLFSTLTVIEAIANHYPSLIEKYHQSMQVIYPVDRPLNFNNESKGLFKRVTSNWFFRKKLPLAQFTDHPNFVIDLVNASQPIGVSLDLSDGFVEAGTVAYVATQLAYSLKATEINLYGIDLMNSSQPRFYESKDKVAPSKLDKAITNRIVPSFDLLAKVYNKQGVKVINHSPVSKGLFY